MIYGNWDLTDLVLSDTIHQGYLFRGISGIGKATLAAEKAKMILCMDPERSPDFVRLSGSDGAIKKDDVLGILPILERSPQGAYRVVLVDNANRATVEAQNSLLKVLENPPAPTVFLFVAHTDEKGLILSTIASRCVPIHFRPLPIDVLTRMMHKEPVDVEDLEIALACSGGSYAACRKCLRDSELQELFRVLIFERGTSRLSALNLLKEKAELPVLLGPLLRGYLQALCDLQIPLSSRILKSFDLEGLRTELPRAGFLRTALRKSLINELTREELLILFS